MLDHSPYLKIYTMGHSFTKGESNRTTVNTTERSTRPQYILKKRYTKPKLILHEIYTGTHSILQER
jgi:hypothetical protein